MIRLFVLIGIVGGSLIVYLTTFAVSPEFQLPPAVSLLKKFEADGVIPGPNAVSENEQVEHGIFEVPPEDERQLDKVEATAGMKMESGGAMKMDGESKGGLKISEQGSFDREINLKMAEWRFSDKNIEVKRGERIRFNISNDGKIPHEFMFMTMPAMTAINYRVTRADWSLLEHEALFEKSLVLPGGEFSLVVEIQANSSWMFMCMLPYHMQMGMMGQMATPGFAMEM